VIKPRNVVLLSLALVLALPAIAAAGLPQAKSTLIVPNKSIGGVALGATTSAVEKAWGKSGNCEFDCIYEAARKSETELPSSGTVLLEEKKPGDPKKVWLITLRTGSKVVNGKSIPNFDTPLTKLKTSKGIGLGSKASELARAYPKAKRKGIAGGAYYYEITGPKEVATSFSFSETNKVIGINVESHPGG
jgi:hypothetical protein